MLSQSKSICPIIFLHLLFLSSPIIKLAHAYNGNVTSVPGKNERVAYTKKYQLSNDFDFHLTSDIPVTVYRYTDNRKAFTSELIPENDMWLFIKTSCLSYRWKLGWSSWSDGLISMNITANMGGDDLGHIPTSNGSIEAKWNYNVCDRRLRGGQSGHNVFQNPPDIVSTFSKRSLQPNNPCAAAVQIVYDGCKRLIKVDAPSLRVTTARMENEQEQETTKECVHRFEGNITSVKTFKRDSINAVTVRKLSGNQCNRT
jgi:hypothetical protein